MTFAQQLRKHADDARVYARSKMLEVGKHQKALDAEQAEVTRLLKLAEDYERAAAREEA